ncbi:putative Ig domain-containing protein [Larkinella sp. VNQ87]|uniref:putative Ig domain-containing protein n=1 Tax=Larkinella sp. VNQ87 TaxID=3400921 RepID=UPI003C0E814B
MTNFSTLLRSLVLAFALTLGWFSSTYGQYKPGFSEEVYANDLSGAVGFTFDKNGAMYVWTIDGRVHRIDPQTKQRSQLLDISGEIGRYDDFGLLGMTLDNNFLDNGRFYLFYVIKYASVKWQGTYARVTRYEANKNDNFRSIKADSRKILIGAPDPNNPSKGVPGDCIPLTSNSHAGGGIVMGTDGSLIIPTGDGAAAAFDQGSYSESYYNQSIQNGFMTAAENIGSYRSQVDYSLSGKILRINPENGDGLPGNPNFDAGAPRSIKSRIYASGMRQPFRGAVRPNSGSTDINAGNPGAIYVGEVGFTDWEEINVIKKGANYGWPYEEGQNPSTRPYNKTEYKPAGVTFTKPVIAWRSGPGQINRNGTLTDVRNSPSGALPGYCAIGGSWHPGGGNYPTEYQNAYYFADFNGGWISKMAFDGDNQPQPETIAKLLDGGSSYQYITCIAFNPVDKNMYYLRYPENGGERVRRVVYNGGGGSPPVAIIVSDKTNGASPLTVKFTGNTSYDPEGKPLTYAWSFGDNTTSTAANPEKTFTTNSSTSTNFTVKLTVTDADGKTATAEKVITVSSASNSAPVIVSTSVDNQTEMDLTDIRNINLSANITDETPADQLSYKWTVSLFHNDHQHDDFITTSRTATASLPPIGCDGTLTYWYGVKLEVTDAGGLKTETIRYIYPNCSGNSQTINFNPIGDRAPNAAAFTPEASATSGKPVVFYVIEGPAVIAEGKIFLTGRLGKVTVRAAQHGGDGFKPARPVERSFNVVSDASDKQPPSTPTNLAISNVTQNSMRLTWNGSTDNVGVTGYEVYQNNTKIADVTSGTAYNVTGLSPGTEYYFFVRAVDATGNVSANSNTATETTTGSSTPTNQPPVAPTVSNLTATINTAYTSAALPVFTDPNNDALTYALSGLPNGLSFNTGSRVISGTPTQTGTFNLTYSATDGKSSPVTVTLTLAVNEGSGTPPVNQPPVAPAAFALLATLNVPYNSGALPVFTDPNNDALTYALSGLPNGLSFNTGSRVISGTPTQSGSFNLTYSATDGKSEPVTVTLTLTVGAGGVITGNFEGYLDVVNCSTISGWVFNYDSPNAPYTVEFLAATGANPAITSATVVGTTVANIFRQDLLNAGKGNGAHGYSFIVPETIKNNQQQTIWARVQGSTYVLMWSPKTLTCQGTGTPTNQPPVAPTVSNLTATLNVAYTMQLPAFTDTEPLTYSLTGLPEGLSFNTSTRTISGTPTQTGNFNLVYSATDSQTKTDLTVTLAVAAGGTTNPAPVPPAILPLSATVNIAYTMQLPAFSDAQPLIYTLTGLPNGLNFNAGNRTISGTPTQQGTFNLTYSANDGTSRTDISLTLTVAAGGNPPVITGNFEGYLDGVNCNNMSGWVFNYDSPNAPYTVEFLAATGANPAITSATVIGTTVANIFRQDLLNAGKGNGAHGYSFTVPNSIKNNQQQTIWARVQGSTYVLMWSPKTLTCEGTGTPPVNQPPVAPSVSNLTATVNTAYTSAALPVFTDPNNDALTYSLTGLPNGLSFTTGSRVISGTPTQTGTFSLVYSATDGKSEPVTVGLTLTVNEGNSNPPTNQAPVAPTLAALSATLNVAYNSGALPVFTDPNNDPLTYSLIGLPNGLSFNTDSRVISGTPTQQGSFNLTYSATDGSLKTDLAVTLTISASVPSNDNFEGYLTQEVNCNTLSGWAYDRTKPNAALTIEFFDGPSIAAGTPIGSILASAFRQHLKDAGKGNGEHWYDFPIPESLKDGQNHTIWARVQGTAYVLKWAPKIINCVGTGTPPANQPPVAPSVSNLTATVNTAYTSAALPVFTDPNNDALTYALSGLPNGLSFNTGSRVISGTPTQTGTFNLTYSATDGKSSPVTVTITLTVNEGSGTPPVNQPPVAPSVSNLTATVNTAYSSAALPVFTDPNNDALTYALSGLPNGLSFNTGSRVISGTPPQTGSFNLTYSATDGKSEPVTLTLTLTVNPATSTPPLPAANFDGYLTQEVNCNTLSGWAYDRTSVNRHVTVEFFDGPSIAAGTPIGSIVASAFRQHLKDAGKGNGEHWYDFPIPESLKDGQNHTIWARVQGSEFILKWAPKTINCAGSGTPTVNQPPVAPTVSNLTATVNTAYSSAALPVFTDPNNDALTYALSGLPNGLSFNTGSRVISGTPTQTGSFNLTYSATDGKSEPVTAGLTLTVNEESSNPPTNQPPVAPTVSNLTATVNTAYSSAALPVFTDPNNDALTYALSGLPNGLSFNTGSRVISGTPTQTGSFNLTYSATDGKSDPVSVNLALTVSESNNPPTSGSSGPGNYEGYLDVVNCSSIQGWIWDRDKPNTVIAVEFLDGNTVIGSTDANIFRQDLKNANKGNGVHGYSFAVPASLKDGKAHSISGRVPNSTFVLKWSPKTLTCPAGSREAAPTAELTTDLSVSPNPSTGRFTVDYRLADQQKAQLQVVDVLGRVLWQKGVIGTGQPQRETVDLREGGTGLHFIQIKTDGQQLIKRLLINR